MVTRLRAPSTTKPRRWCDDGSPEDTTPDNHGEVRVLRQEQHERVEPAPRRAPTFVRKADMKISEQPSERHVLTVMVDNEAGILAKIAGLFTARGYNIDSLTVADITENHALSRITIVTHGPPPVIDQIRAQLERLVPVHKATAPP